MTFEWDSVNGQSSGTLQWERPDLVTRGSLRIRIVGRVFESSVREKQRDRKEGIMKKKFETELDDDLRPEYDLSKLKGGVRGKYAQRFKQGTNLVLLSPEVARYFPDERAVNLALKTLVGIAKAQLRHAH